MPGDAAYDEAPGGVVLDELRAWVDCRGDGFLAFSRATSGFEVDVVLDDAAAMAVEPTRHVVRHDLKSPRTIGDEASTRRGVLACLEPSPRTEDGIDVLPWRESLTGRWDGPIFCEGSRAPRS